MTSVLLMLSALACQGGVGPFERADQWPHWRGPNANGTAPRANPPLHWDAKTNIKWKVPLLGRGSASPIVWGDQVFVVTAVATDKPARAEDLPKDDGLTRKTQAPKTYHRFVVFSFDRQTGKLRWQHQAAERVPHEGHHFSHSYAAGSPTTDGRHLYAAFGSFGIYCYDLDGKLKWSRDLGKMKTRLGWGEAVTPVIHGPDLLINWDQEQDAALYCLDAATGRTKWQASRDEKTSWNTPLVVEHKGTTQVILNGTNRVRGYDLATGKELWQCPGMTVNAIPSPVAAAGVVYVMSGYGASVAAAIPLDVRGNVDPAQLVWQHKPGTPYVPSPLLLDGRLYFTKGNNALLSIVDAKTGQTILDRERLPGQSSFYGSPVAAAGRIYLTDRDGVTLVLKQNERLEVLATNALGDKMDATPALVGRQIFMRGERYLWCIEQD